MPYIVCSILPNLGDFYIFLPYIVQIFAVLYPIWMISLLNGSRSERYQICFLKVPDLVEKIRQPTARSWCGKLFLSCRQKLEEYLHTANRLCTKSLAKVPRTSLVKWNVMISSHQLMINVKHQVSSVKHQASSIKHQASNVKHQVSSVL